MIEQKPSTTQLYLNTSKTPIQVGNVKLKLESIILQETLRLSTKLNTIGLLFDKNIKLQSFVQLSYNFTS